MPPTVTQDVASILKERALSLPPQRKANKWIPVALVVLMAALLLSGYLRSTATKKEQSVLVTVVGAASDIAPGSKLTFSSLHYVQIPERYYSDAMLKSNEEVVGSIVKYFVPRGEPITKAYLFAKNQSVSSNLETHERAISLKLDDDAVVDRTIASDDLVDVLVTLVKDGKHYTKTIAQNVRVLLATTKEALESRTLRATQANVTLAATPDQCESITAASDSGKLKLVLRSRLSATVSNLSGVSEDDLLPAKAFLGTISKPISRTAEPPAFPQFLAPPPIALPETISSQNILSQPLGWMVDVFTGSKKETINVPASTQPQLRP